MPSSTPWYRHPQDIATEPLRSPSPPTAYYEPLTPPSGSSLLAHGPAQPEWTEHQSSQHIIHGLGVSYDAGNDERSSFRQPPELYLDQNGAAHIGHSRTMVNGYRHSTLMSGRSGHDSIRPHTRDGNTIKRSRVKAHARSGSTIDDLATAAIAASPTFLSSGSPTSHQVDRPATSYTYSQHPDDNERPYKRIRSEYVPQNEWSPKADGLRWSEVSPEHLLKEAELLLYFKAGHKSPPAQSKPNEKINQSRADARKLLTALNIPVGASSLRDTDTKGQTFGSNADARKPPPMSPQTPEIEPLTTPSESGMQEPPIEIIEAQSLATAKEDTMAVEENHSAAGIQQLFDERGAATKAPAEPPKKPRRKKPEVQAEECAKCQQLQRSHDDDFWIECKPCSRWFHCSCAGFRDGNETKAVDKFVCTDCHPVHGPTTFVRKSSRARTAIDYAGLNQGVIKSSADTSMHHYVQPIKDGKIKFQPDRFPRIRPELVRADYFEKADGIKQPTVVPAEWNPRFGDLKLSAQDPAAQHESAHDGIIAETTEGTDDDNMTEDEVIECGQDLLDMVMPRDLTVRKVSDIYGPLETVIVIDVKSQQSSNQWTMAQWADYYEKEDKDKVVRNVISLEISKSRLGRLIRRPKLVREMDLQDQVWPDANKTPHWRPVQLYCLMSVADSYTDFHIDFGGSSVYYHILRGKKTFFFIPPEDKNLKKYEDWCNSDLQESTFLGDLTGDCSRVDLSEGDTMFIPAGWIHAVWTPEDSLVIGGNYLTQTDYKMQFKIVEIEKNTGVSQQFRYPFFQKVMWFALIKYLEEDPVPQEVIDDFNNDEEYAYLRADPIWLEVEEPENMAEPGQPEYNARFYSKAELEGLPYLRDQLYRTALISIDAPVVPPVNKDAAKRVKSSIPKGQGEPMDLIKLFAIWIAWKQGNVMVPEWAHADLDTLQKSAENREKLKKPEVFRIPPERTSSRKSSQTLNDAPGGASTAFTADGTTTPTQTKSRGVDGEYDDSARPSSASKTSGLGPKRSACDTCRKRRIRCRHREDPDGFVALETPRPRSISNVASETPQLSTAVLSESTANVTPERQQYREFGDTVPSNIAQMALATLDGQIAETVTEVTTTPTASSGKKGRSKACEECRKSKRRCVHDEHGRVDPAKAAEPSKPRGSSGTKRASLPGDDGRQPQTKRPPLDSETSGPRAQPDMDAMIDPALLQHGLAASAGVTQHSPEDEAPLVQSAAEAVDVLAQQSIGQAEAVQNFDPMLGIKTSPLVPPVSIDPLLYQQIAPEPSPGLLMKTEPAALKMDHVASQTPAGSLASPPDSTMAETAASPTEVNGIKITTSIESNGEKPEGSPEEFYTPVSASRQSSRQPKTVDRYVPDNNQPPAKQTGKPTNSDRRYSSSGGSGATPGSSDESRRSSSNTSGTTHQMAVQNGGTRSRENSARPGSRGSTALGSEADADEAFARKLQAQENGLRRRASGRI